VIVLVLNLIAKDCVLKNLIQTVLKKFLKNQNVMVKLMNVVFVMDMVLLKENVIVEVKFLIVKVFAVEELV